MILILIITQLLLLHHHLLLLIATTSALAIGKVSASVPPAGYGGNHKNTYTRLHIALLGFANASFAQSHGLEGKEL
jgi:hypothetical protein